MNALNPRFRRRMRMDIIGILLEVWSSPDHCHEAEHCNMIPENTLILLYNVVDLLLVKGLMNFHPDVFEILIRSFKWKGVPLHKCLAMLWEYRRLGHVLCAFSVNESFITTLSQHCGELSQSIDFWIRFIKGSEAQGVGFQQNFSLMFQSDIKVEEVKKAASELLSSVSLPSGSAFTAAYLYQDLSEKLVSSGSLIESILEAWIGQGVGSSV
ncbi:unnamed protein product [Ilex paraguariensis]|uniref:Uncharacterized protein n=1 Tax=Ilex paraguariensis TaxID=185542 RepID=A0ABC8UWL7_9AQUA